MTLAKSSAIGTGALVATTLSLALSSCALAGGAGAEKKPPAAKPVPFCAGMDRIGLLAASAPGRVVITGETQSITLLPACGPPFIGQRVASSPAQRFILLIDDLRAQKPAGTVFTLNFAEAGGDMLTNDASTVGTLNFFAAPHPDAKGAPRRLSFDVTKTVRAMAEANHFEHLVIVLKPSQPPPAGAELSVGAVQIVEQ